MEHKLVLGLGNNIDYEIVWDSAVLEQMVQQYGIGQAELDTGTAVESERDLVVSILSFLQAGEGGERFVADPAVLESFSHHFKYGITLGGTGPRAAIAMDKLGVKSSLHLVTLNDHVRRLLPKGVEWFASAVEERVYPHAIMQFGKGVRVKAGDIDITAPRANRLIYVNDEDNTGMHLSPELGEELATADVFLLSGFNAMRDEALLAKRLITLQRAMARLPRTARVFFEDACYHNAALSRQVREAIDGRVHIYSMNEDEMQAYLGRRVDLLNAGEVAKGLKELGRIIPAPVLVLHTKYWALAYGEKAAAYRAPLDGGMTMASTRFAHGDAYGKAEYDAVAALPREAEGTAFAAEIEKQLGNAVCCRASIDVRVEKPTTIGLGDSFVGGFLAAL